ncbi:hypothetical protein J4475_03570, partial [Candidatus Woesearchaeota archaeon]|nr:hypothetical protein [Candidatus Woesearchaeota archaeon]
MTPALGNNTRWTCAFWSNFSGVWEKNLTGQVTLNSTDGPLFDVVFTQNTSWMTAPLNQSNVYAWNVNCTNQSGGSETYWIDGTLNATNVTENATIKAAQFNYAFEGPLDFGGMQFTFSQGPPLPLKDDLSDSQELPDFLNISRLAIRDGPVVFMALELFRNKFQVAEAMHQADTGQFVDPFQLNVSINASNTAPVCTKNASSPGKAWWWIYSDIDGNASTGCYVNGTNSNTSGMDIGILVNGSNANHNPQLYTCNFTGGIWSNPANINDSGQGQGVLEFDQKACDTGNVMVLINTFLLTGVPQPPEGGVMKFYATSHNYSGV